MEDLSRAVWHTSASGGVGNCVEVAFVADKVALRGSKDPYGRVLLFTHREWDAFIRGAQLGEFDFPDIVRSAPRGPVGG
jgi:hypothetical protein